METFKKLFEESTDEARVNHQIEMDVNEEMLQEAKVKGQSTKGGAAAAFAAGGIGGNLITLAAYVLYKKYKKSQAIKMVGRYLGDGAGQKVAKAYDLIGVGAGTDKKTRQKAYKFIDDALKKAEKLKKKHAEDL